MQLMRDLRPALILASLLAVVAMAGVGAAFVLRLVP